MTEKWRPVVPEKYLRHYWLVAVHQAAILQQHRRPRHCGPHQDHQEKQQQQQIQIASVMLRTSVELSLWMVFWNMKIWWRYWPVHNVRNFVETVLCSVEKVVVMWWNVGIIISIFKKKLTRYTILKSLYVKLWISNSSNISEK